MKLFLFILLAPAVTFAAELRLCSQNLFRFGSPESNRQLARGTTQGDYLVDRFKEAKCDVIAVQEVVGNSKDQARRNLERLSTALQVLTGEEFEARVGENHEDVIRNGFLTKKSKVRIVEELSEGGPLPKLNPLGPARRVTRDPLAVMAEVSGKRVLLVSFHFKSKAGGYKDPTKTEYEILRMESAEGLRVWVERLFSEKKADIAAILGDRNNDSDSANAQILNGELKLEDFKRGGSCRLDQRLAVSCQDEPERNPTFIPVITDKVDGGTFKFKGEEQVLDEILVDLRNKEKVAGAGVVGNFKQGSDHKLAWVTLRW